MSQWVATCLIYTPVTLLLLTDWLALECTNRGDREFNLGRKLNKATRPSFAPITLPSWDSDDSQPTLVPLPINRRALNECIFASLNRE